VINKQANKRNSSGTTAANSVSSMLRNTIYTSSAQVS